MRRSFVLSTMVAFGVLIAPVGASAQDRVREPLWAPLATATIHPGVQTVTAGAQCTANFVFYDRGSVYLGQAAHCSGTDGNTVTNGCEAGVLPLGTRVDVEGARAKGVIVYNSWETMQRAGEKDANACNYNDFALIRLDRRDRGTVNPSVPSWGGPVGLARGSEVGERVYSYGRSGLWLGIGPLSPRQGISLGQQGAGWTHKVYTAPPGIPGDSGSAFLDADGRALGVLSTIEFLPFAASNNVTDLRAALRYMRAHTRLDEVRLAHGTEAFAA